MRPEQTEKIVVGGLLVGKGKMWLDDLRISIDGKDIKDLKEYEKKTYRANLDKAFDSGSHIENLSLDSHQWRNLELLELVWGYLKYYHPSVATGTYNWDYELFRILPKVLASKSSTQRDSILTAWIRGLGPFEGVSVINTEPSEIKMKPDLDWINKSGLSQELTTLLIKVKNANRADTHFYVDLAPGVGNPVFKNEKPYSSNPFPDVGYRLLALYRYWNIIQYYFPYKNLIAEDWKLVLKEFIPKFIKASNEKEYTLAVLELIARVHDTHANIWGENEVLNNYWALNYANVRLSFVENNAVVTGFNDNRPERTSGLNVGDVITMINNKPVEAIVKERLKLTPTSNYPTQLRDIASNLLRTNDSSLLVQFIRAGKKETKTLKTFAAKDINVASKFYAIDTCFKLLNKDVAYINNGSLKRKYLFDLWKEIQNTRGLIIDIRNYPSDMVLYDLSNYMVSLSTPFVKFTNGSIKMPGLFSYRSSLNVGTSNGSHYKGSVVILVNEVTQSSAEFHAMAYKVFPNVLVVGSTTAGADGNVSQFYLPGGISTMISGIGVYYPDNWETQRIGIVPDLVVKPTIEGIKNGRDELIENAVQILEKNN